MTGRRIINAGSQLNVDENNIGIKCSLKANEGFLYLLEREVMFVPKLSRLIDHSEISSVTFSRVSGGVSTRTVDLVFTLKGNTEVSFSNIRREEYPIIEMYFTQKKIKLRNELAADSSRSFKDIMGAYGGVGAEDDDDDDDDVSMKSISSEGSIQGDSEDERFVVGSDDESGMSFSSSDTDDDVIRTDIKKGKSGDSNFDNERKKRRLSDSAERDGTVKKHKSN